MKKTSIKIITFICIMTLLTGCSVFAVPSHDIAITQGVTVTPMPTAEITATPTEAPEVTGEEPDGETSPTDLLVPTQAAAEPTETAAEPTASADPTDAIAPTETVTPTEAADSTETTDPADQTDTTGSPEPAVTDEPGQSPEPTQAKAEPTSAEPTKAASEPTSTEAPKATEALTPTSTPVPTKADDPTATPTVKPTATPTVTPAPVKATNTPVPTSKPTNTPVPTSKPTSTPTPVPTHTPTPIPVPTYTPTPTATSTPTPTPTPAKPYLDKWGYNYYLQQDAANGTECAKTYKTIYEGIMAYKNNGGSTEINIGLPNLCNSTDLETNLSTINSIYYSIYCDNPQIVWIGSEIHYSYSYYVDENDNNKIIPTNYIVIPTFFSLTDYNFDALLAECYAARDEVSNLITSKYGSNATKLQKVKIIHDYIVTHKQYDIDVARDKNYTGAETVFNQNMLGIFASDYEPVCMSYATAFKWLCNYFGVQCEIISSEGHAWNRVNYGENVDYSNSNADYHSDTWYEIDVTFDDPTLYDSNNNYINDESYISYNYYNITLAAMQEKDIASGSDASTHVETFKYYPAYPTTCTGTTFTYAYCTANGLF